MIVLRHCQSVFNLHYTRTRCDPGIVDPALTEEGRAQALLAATTLCGPDALPIERLLVSPYRRALQTAAPLIERLGLTPRITPLVRERYAFSCDIGSPRSVLEADFPELDFDGLDEVWWHDGTLGEDGRPLPESEASVLDRAARFRDEMARHPAEERTLLVSHWGFLLCLSGRSLQNGQSSTLDPNRPLDGPVVWQY
jgi:broad specificity phosphatase PhoE